MSLFPLHKVAIAVLTLSAVRNRLATAYAYQFRKLFFFALFKFFGLPFSKER